MSPTDYTDWASEWMWPHVRRVMDSSYVAKVLTNDPERVVVTSLVPNNSGKCDKCRKPANYLAGLLLTIGRLHFAMELCPVCTEEEWGEV